MSFRRAAGFLSCEGTTDNPSEWRTHHDRRPTQDAHDRRTRHTCHAPGRGTQLASTDGEPLPEIAVASGDPGGRTDALRSAILEQGIAIETADDLGGALGTSTRERIQILNGLAPGETFLVLAHEYAHCLLHRADDRPASRDTRELEAEAVAFVVGEAIGLNARQSSRDYLHLYSGDRECLAQSLDRIQRAASVILSAVEAGG